MGRIGGDGYGNVMAPRAIVAQARQDAD